MTNTNIIPSQAQQPEAANAAEKTLEFSRRVEAMQETIPHSAAHALPDHVIRYEELKKNADDAAGRAREHPDDPTIRGEWDAAVQQFERFKGSLTPTERTDIADYLARLREMERIESLQSGTHSRVARALGGVVQFAEDMKDPVADAVRVGVESTVALAAAPVIGTIRALKKILRRAA